MQGRGINHDGYFERGALVLSIDLSDAIDVTASKLRSRKNWFGVQGDITWLPLASNQLDLIYCEGVIQHTRDSKLCVAELCRTLRSGGELLATRYIRTGGRANALRIGIQEFVRSHVSRMSEFPLLLTTGCLAGLSYIPGFGFLLRKSGIVQYQPSMPTLKTTRLNTYDAFGSHTFQRIMNTAEFYDLFNNEEVRLLMTRGEVVVAQKI